MLCTGGICSVAESSPGGGVVASPSPPTPDTDDAPPPEHGKPVSAFVPDDSPPSKPLGSAGETATSGAAGCCEICASASVALAARTRAVRPISFVRFRAFIRCGASIRDKARIRRGVLIRIRVMGDLLVCRLSPLPPLYLKVAPY